MENEHWTDGTVTIRANIILEDDVDYFWRARALWGYIGTGANVSQGWSAITKFTKE